MRPRAVVVAALAASIPVAYLLASAFRPSTADMIAFVPLFLVASAAHEAVHLAAIRAMGKRARVVFYPRLLSLLVVYSELGWREYILAALSAPAIVQAALIALFMYSPTPLAAMLNACHALASAADIYGAAHIAISYRGASMEVVEDGKGYSIVLRSNGHVKKVIKI